MQKLKRYMLYKHVYVFSNLYISNKALPGHGQTREREEKNMLHNSQTNGEELIKPHKTRHIHIHLYMYI